MFLGAGDSVHHNKGFSATAESPEGYLSKSHSIVVTSLIRNGLRRPSQKALPVGT